MPEFSELSLLPFCAGLTLLGLIASWTAWKRRGATAGVRGVAWSLLPVSLYLTRLLELVWDVVRETVDWVAHLAFSPTVWAGIALFGVSVVLFVLTGVVRSRMPAKEPKATTAPPAKGEIARTPKASKKTATDDSSEFDEIEDILKRHGIN